MHPLTRAAPVIALALLAGCQPVEPERFQGYVESEPVRVAAQQAGQLTSLGVQRGDTVAAGAPLFSQDAALESTAVDAARAQLAEARARLANLGTGQRPSEIAAIDAQLADARAQRTLAADQLARQQKLVDQNFVSADSLEQARTRLTQADAAIERIRAQRATARLPGRSQERDAAEAQVSAATAALRQAEVKLAQKSQRAPAAGRVDDVYYRAGEWANPGQPVVSLLPPDHIKVRFFVAEPVLGTLKVGERVNVHCDGCTTPLAATIRYVSTTAEYTPPVLFSEKNRHRLVFLIEAWPAPADAVKLHPGQPVDVTPAPGA